MPARVLGVGNPLIDRLAFVDDNLLEGEKGSMTPITHIELLKWLQTSQIDFKIQTGGSANNTLKGLSKLGHETLFIGKAGKDDDAERFKSGIADYGVKGQLLTSENTPTGTAICLITPDKQRTFRTFLGASQELKGTDLKPEWFQGYQHLHLEGYLLHSENVIETAIDYAKRANLTISLDLSNFKIVEQFKDKLVEILSHSIDILFANKEEVFHLTNESPQKGCSFLADLVPLVVITQSEQGCLIGFKENIFHVPAFLVSPTDTTGAGDLFASGFLHGYLEKKSLEESARLGAKIASEVIQVIGAEVPQSKWDLINLEAN